MLGSGGRPGRFPAECWEARAGLDPRSRQAGAGCALQSGD